MLQVGCSCRIKGFAWDVGFRVFGPHGLRFRFSDSYDHIYLQCLGCKACRGEGV